MSATEELIAELTKRQTELTQQRQTLILQAERQVAYLDGQLAEIVALLKRLRET